MKRNPKLAIIAMIGCGLVLTTGSASLAARNTRLSMDQAEETDLVDAKFFRPSPFHGNPCKSTARVARTACKLDTLDDYYTHTGNCLNLSDIDEGVECMQEARETRREEAGLCTDIYWARRELCEDLEEERFDPEIDPEDFASAEDIASDPHPYFPLVPGNTWVYEGEEETVTVIVTDETIEVMGVECIVVKDLVTSDEKSAVVEDTDDWFAQDLDGNVWYFGEIALNFEDGALTDIDGSWTAGEDYAKPGILIPADPEPGQIYRQEFLLREAEDVAEVVSITAKESVEDFDCDGECLQTLEYSPLEPDAAEHKYYLPGVGLILEVDLEEGERLELVEFIDASVK